VFKDFFYQFFAISNHLIKCQSIKSLAYFMRRVSDVCQEGPMNERVNFVLNSAYCL